MTTEFARAAIAERARLALIDPEGEAEAVAPLTGVRARQILLAATRTENDLLDDLGLEHVVEADRLSA